MFLGAACVLVVCLSVTLPAQQPSTTLQQGNHRTTPCSEDVPYNENEDHVITDPKFQKSLCRPVFQNHEVEALDCKKTVAVKRCACHGCHLAGFHCVPVPGAERNVAATVECDDEEVQVEVVTHKECRCE